MLDKIFDGLPGAIYVSSDRYSLHDLERSDIDMVVDLREDPMRMQREFEDLGITYVHLPMVDSPKENIDGAFVKIFPHIRNVLLRGGNVLIHCHMGVSRSISMAMLTYIAMTRPDTDYKTLIARVRRHRPIANPNPGFRRSIEAALEIFNS